jgi:hypothetical protein
LWLPAHEVVVADFGKLFLDYLQRGQVFANDVLAELEVVLHVDLNRKKDLVHLRLLLQLHLVGLK